MMLWSLDKQKRTLRSCPGFFINLPMVATNHLCDVEKSDVLQKCCGKVFNSCMRRSSVRAKENGGEFDKNTRP